MLSAEFQLFWTFCIYTVFFREMHDLSKNLFFPTPGIRSHTLIYKTHEELGLL